MGTATLLEFARVNDAVAATTRKLQKYSILSDFFRSAGEEDDDLRLAVRYFGGRPSGADGERVLNVGWRLVSEVVLSILKIDAQSYYDLCVRSGEIGEALARVWPESLRPADGVSSLPPLTLKELAIAFDDLADTGERESKRAILRGIYARCSIGREAAYLSKIIFGDMRTGVQEGVLQHALAKAFGLEVSAVQRCQLLVGDLGEVAVLARRGACGTARLRLFHPIQFMLATPQETADDAVATMAGRSFYVEDKLDGIRAQVHKSGDGPAARVEIYTRTMDRADVSFPDVTKAMAKLPGEFLLDGEIVPYRDGCVLPFAHIQRRLGRRDLAARVLHENPVTFIAFDVLYRDGQLLMDKPLRDRRQALHSLCKSAPCVRPLLDAERSLEEPDACPDTALRTFIAEVSTPEQIAAAFDSARARRNEGIVLKDPESPYSPGRRGQAWLKLKTHLPTFDCVVTAAETGHGKRRNWLSDYTFAVWDRDPADAEARLVNLGKAYSGLTDEEIVRLTELFTRLTVQQMGRVRQVQPEVVLEIACDQIQKSARHASGYALRFPRIKRIRWDKRPVDADRLARVAEIYQSTPNFARPASRSEEAAPRDAQLSLFD